MIYHHARNAYEHRYDNQKYEQFFLRRGKRLAESAERLVVSADFHDAEDPQEAKGPYDGKVRVHASRPQREVGRSDGEQIHDAVETENVIPFSGRRGYAQSVFHSEENDYDRLKTAERVFCGLRQSRHSFGEEQNDGNRYQKKHGAIERPTRSGVGAPNHVADFHWWSPPDEYFSLIGKLWMEDNADSTWGSG